MKTKKEKPTKLERFFKFLHFFERHLYRLVFPYRLHGNTEKYNQGSLITIGNHYSYMDVVFPCLVTDRPIRFVAKQELFDEGGFMGWFVRKCGCVAAKRDGSDVATVKECLKILRNGGVINIFPEGTRNRSYKDILPFHSGAAALSIKTQTPIIPIVKITKIKLFRKTHVVVGDPIEFRKYYGKKVTKEQLDECDNVLREAVRNMRLAFIERNKIKIKSDKV